MNGQPLNALIAGITIRVKLSLQRSSIYGVFRKMSSIPNEAAEEKPITWLDEKKRYLGMSLIDKRKEYKCGDNFFPISKIPTWRSYVLQHSFLADKIPLAPGFHIEPSLNSILSEKVSIFRGDITTLEIDAIVNAANRSLLGGGGVDGAIHRAAGPFLLAENRTLGGCEVGEVKVTGGYQLPARYVFATVGPQGEKPDMLQMCYKRGMDALLEKRLKTIAFPCISTGIYGYPLKPAAHIACGEVRRQLELHHNQIERVIFCIFSEVDEEIYQGTLQSYFPLK